MNNIQHYKKNYFILIFFIVLSFISLARIYDNATQLDSWQYGEWLINYKEGFVRRGLIGEVIYFFSGFLNDNLQTSYILLLSIIVLFYYYLNYKLVRNIKFTFINYFIVFSPLFYLFFVVISKIGIKKEIILYIFYLLYLLHLSKVDFEIKKNWKYILFFPFLLLNHEGQFFYIPYIIIPLFFLIKKNQIYDLKLQASVLIIISSVLMILLYNYRGTAEHTSAICNSLGNYAPGKCDWWGPIFALSLNLGDDWGHNFSLEWLFSYIHTDYKAYFGFLFYILYSFFPFYLLFKFLNLKKNKFLIDKKKYLKLLLITFIFSLPLFHLAQDWSRWFSIHFHLLAFLTFFLQSKNIINFNINSLFKKINNKLTRGDLKKYFVISLLVYGTFLHHHHFFFKGVKLELTYYKVIKKIISNY